MTSGKKNTYDYIRNNFQNKMQGYKKLCNQTTGNAGAHRPTPTQLNNMSKWVDKGAVICNVTNQQLNKWAGKPRNWTVTTAKTTLTNKFGKTNIKAVAWNKSGGFLVATNPTRQGKPFGFTS